MVARTNSSRCDAQQTHTQLSPLHSAIHTWSPKIIYLQVQFSLHQPNHVYIAKRAASHIETYIICTIYILHTHDLALCTGNNFKPRMRHILDRQAPIRFRGPRAVSSPCSPYRMGRASPPHLAYIRPNKWSFIQCARAHVCMCFLMLFICCCVYFFKCKSVVCIAHAWTKNTWEKVVL